jgi:hypothetical protein
MNGQECVEAFSKEPLSIDAAYWISGLHTELKDVIEDQLSTWWNVVSIQEESKTKYSPHPHALVGDPIYILSEAEAHFIVQCAGPNREMVQLSFRLTSDGKLLLVKEVLC